MRLIMLDTETTGLSPLNGDRMVEIGAIEVSHRRIRHDSKFHYYLNPGRHIPQEVVRIHGIDDDKVKDAPGFAEIADEFLNFIDGATLVIHNAPFDLRFIMHELQLSNMPDIGDMMVIDTLEFARTRHAHQRNSLDALCDRYGVERGHRELHGALLDAELLAEVYLAMTGGRQFSLGVDPHAQKASSFVQLPKTTSSRDEQVETAAIMRREPPPIREDEHMAHRALMQRIHEESEGRVIWRQPAESH
ncbi:MAG: DNA polymerase III subunit epsilon [Mariprofundaceae bacterium]|nr:DNA polymerase III subunit epsilon [Mariprofundaceae bacterium]